MDSAVVVFDRTADNGASGKLDATSQTPKKVTVEDYFSETEQPKHLNVVNKMETLREPQEPRKPKRATVSFVDEQNYSRSSDYHDEASRLSEALTAVPSNSAEGDRVSSRRDDPYTAPERNPNGSSAASQQKRRLLQRNPRVSYPSESEEDEDWYSGHVPRRFSDRRPPNLSFDTGFTGRDGRAADEPGRRGNYSMFPYHADHGPMYPRPIIHYSHEPPLPLKPQSNTRPQSFQSEVSGSTFTGEYGPRDLPRRYQLPSYHRYHPLTTPPGSSPPPPPRPQPAVARKLVEEHPQEDRTSGLAQDKDVDEREKRHSVMEAERMEKYQDLMRNLQKTLDMYKSTETKLEDKVSAKHNLSVPSKSPLANNSQNQSSMTDLDLIKLMEERMQALKRKNEDKIIEANRVLAFFDRRSERDHRKPDDKTASKQPSDKVTEVPNVHMFRTPEDETDYDDDNSQDSVSTDHDSMAGNSSGSSLSSLGRRMRLLNTQRNTTGIARNRGMARDVARSTADGSTEDQSLDSDESDHESMESQTEASLDVPVIAEDERIDNTREVQTHPAPSIRVDHDVMEEVLTLRRDLSILKRQITRKDENWLGDTLFAAMAKWRKHLRNPPRPGTQRLEWTCECGDEMYADLPVENGAQYQQMLEFLTRSGPKTQQANQNQTTPSQLEGGSARLDYTSMQLSQSSFGQGASPASTIGSGSTCVGSGSSQFPNAQQNDPFARNRYLELCVNTGKYETKLAEIQVSSSQSSGAAICTDAHLFRQIYHRYSALRKHTWRRFLYRPAGIKFVHFGVQAGYRVSFFSSDPLPSEDEIAAKRYEYSLQPPVPPPIDSRTFLHYFYKHDAHSHSTSAKYVHRLPKKLGDSLVRSLGVDDLLEGWGIHIIEGPNKVAICWALMMVLVASLGVSIGYGLVTRSGDSGFAIGQWMVAALTVGLSALYFSLEDEVSSNFD